MKKLHQKDLAIGKGKRAALAVTEGQASGSESAAKRTTYAGQMAQNRPDTAARPWNEPTIQQSHQQGPHDREEAPASGGTRPWSKEKVVERLTPDRRGR